MGIEQPMLLPKSHAGDSTKNPVQWDTKKDLTKDIIIANFEALGLNGAVFTAGKSGKMPYGQIKKYFRGNDVVINPGTPTSITTQKTEDLQFYYHPDHLGSSNYITDASGEVYQHQEYFPFGETFVEERNDAEYTTYLFNGKELDEETGLYYYGARYYDPRVSLFYGVDRFAEKYSDLSPYHYALNNPLRFIDLNGDSAWAITNQWNNRYITKYHESIQNTIKSYQQAGKEFTCEDLALSVMMDFAEQNGLPVTITNGSGTFDARSDAYTDAATFKNDVLSTTAAPDLQNNKNTVTISVKDARSGDIILNRTEEGRAHHTQVVYSQENSIGIMGIKQGNSGIMNAVPGASRIFGAGNPSSVFYTGKHIESAIYIPGADFYKNYTTGKTMNHYSTQKNIVFKRWNFSKF